MMGIMMGNINNRRYRQADNDFYLFIRSQAMNPKGNLAEAQRKKRNCPPATTPQNFKRLWSICSKRYPHQPHGKSLIN